MSSPFPRDPMQDLVTPGRLGLVLFLVWLGYVFADLDRAGARHGGWYLQLPRGASAGCDWSERDGGRVRVSFLRGVEDPKLGPMKLIRRHSLEAKAYEVRFRARSEASRQGVLKLQIDQPPWTGPIFQEPIAFEPTERAYRFVIRPTEGSLYYQFVFDLDASQAGLEVADFAVTALAEEAVIHEEGR